MRSTHFFSLTHSLPPPAFHTLTHTCAHTHAHTHICTYTCTHTNTHTHTHTHIHTTSLTALPHSWHCPKLKCVAATPLPLTAHLNKRFHAISLLEESHSSDLFKPLFVLNRYELRRYHHCYEIFNLNLSI